MTIKELLDGLPYLPYAKEIEGFGLVSFRDADDHPSRPKNCYSRELSDLMGVTIIYLTLEYSRKENQAVVMHELGHRWLMDNDVYAIGLDGLWNHEVGAWKWAMDNWPYDRFPTDFAFRCLKSYLKGKCKGITEEDHHEFIELELNRR